MKISSKILCLMLLLVLVNACKEQKHTPEPDKPFTEGSHGEPLTVSPPSIEDLTSYFGVSKEQTTIQAIALISSGDGEKTVNGKVISITKSEVITQNDQEGKFTLRIEGTIDGKNFTGQEYDFEGFAKVDVEYQAPTIEDIKAYFNINNNETVAQAIALISSGTGEKTVNGKVIIITKSEVIASNDRDGKFTVKIEGRVSGNPFSEQYSFEGLTKKPEDYHMATRAYVRWKSEFAKNPEQTSIAFDELYRLKQTAKFTVEYLSQWIELYSSNVDGTTYKYTDEDLKKTSISDIAYDNIAKKLSFVITYNGTMGATTVKDRPAISFDHDMFYKSKISVRKEEIQKFYMQGVYKYLDLFINKFATMEGDNSNQFALEYVENSKNFSADGNYITCKLSLAPVLDGDNILAEFDFTFEGFKPLSDLKAEWGLATSSQLGEEMGRRFNQLSDGDVLDQVRKYPITNWIKLAQMYINRDKSPLMLTWDKSEMNGQEVDALIARSAHTLQNGDILLQNPRFELIMAKKEGNNLILQVALTAANEVSLDEIVTTFTVVLH